jgi:serine/threonine protein kinase
MGCTTSSTAAGPGGGRRLPSAPPGKGKSRGTEGGGGGGALVVMLPPPLAAPPLPQPICTPAAPVPMLALRSTMPPTATPFPFPAPTLEDVYLVGAHPIGRGHYGKVFPGRRRDGAGGEVAIKVLARDRSRPLRLLLEVAVHARLGTAHPGILALRDVFEAPATVALVFDRADGELFTRVSNKGPYEEAGAARIVRRLASALAFCHARGVVHRDLKPENVLLGPGGDDTAARICDFGLAHLDWGAPTAPAAAACTSGMPPHLPPQALVTAATEGGRSAATLALLARLDTNATGVPDHMRTVCGTWAYSAPEIPRPRPGASSAPSAQPAKGGGVKGGGASGDGTYSHMVDLFSLGLILYILLAGFHPYDPAGTASDEALQAAILSGAYTFNDAAFSRVSAAAKDLIRRLLVADPRQRLDTAGVLAHPWVVRHTGEGEEGLLAAATEEAAGAGGDGVNAALPSSATLHSGPSSPSTAAAANAAAGRFTLLPPLPPLPLHHVPAAGGPPAIKAESARGGGPARAPLAALFRAPTPAPAAATGGTGSGNAVHRLTVHAPTAAPASGAPPPPAPSPPSVPHIKSESWRALALPGYLDAAPAARRGGGGGGAPLSARTRGVAHAPLPHHGRAGDSGGGSPTASHGRSQSHTQRGGARLAVSGTPGEQRGARQQLEGEGGRSRAGSGSLALPPLPPWRPIVARA